MSGVGRFAPVTTSYFQPCERPLLPQEQPLGGTGAGLLLSTHSSRLRCAVAVRNPKTCRTIPVWGVLVM